MKYPLFTCFLLLTLTSFSQSRQQQLMRAEVLVADSNYGKAITIYSQLLKTDSTDFEVYQKRGDLYRDMHDYAQALNDYSYSIHYNRRNCLCWIRRAALFDQLEEYEKSLMDYNSALPLAEEKDMKLLVLVNRAEAKRRLKQNVGAASDFKLAYQVDSTNLGVLADLGATLGDEHPEEALFYLGKAIVIDSTFEGGLGNMAFLYIKLKNYKKAMELSNKLLRIKPNEPYALNNRGYAKMQLGDLEGALEDINNSILLLPYNSFAFRNRGMLYLKQNRKAEACNDFFKALALGFTKEYGDEVERLIKENCGKKAEPDKM